MTGEYIRKARSLVKPSFLGALALLGGLSPAAADALAQGAGSYRIAPNSSIRFHVGQVAGAGINGSFGSFGGSFAINGNDVSKSSVAFTLYPKSVRAGEPRVEDFLRSNAVFDVAEHPQITFRSTSVRRIGPNEAAISGVLTARGRSGPAKFDARLRQLGSRSISFHVTGSIYRTAYGMGVGAPIYSNVVQFDMVLNGTRR
ncbi:polyisoprenoid-binding protein [Pseudaminobacter sp. 19-2017]|uniref:Polyisoprenoid-binding protein n=1 Tax=Pseudaminobacter soli (ex Zhang et al. 2022) TaxID=2831468 RepID=A0A942I256_9HYPH|nr:YceI family protein [Pseudaminobacter soli]MBS3649097.1 polyisoprenoid-binding protein [Pseudaminobacter soli]